MLGSDDDQVTRAFAPWVTPPSNARRAFNCSVVPELPVRLPPVAGCGKMVSDSGAPGTRSTPSPPDWSELRPRVGSEATMTARPGWAAVARPRRAPSGTMETMLGLREDQTTSRVASAGGPLEGTRKACI